ncbi:MAG: hypothetical protein ABIO29_03615, partial [Sphingomicrobium sp.]
VNLHRMTLGYGVRAYQTPQGACVLFGDFLATLDVPMKIDIGAGVASGWAFSEKNKIKIDRHSLTAEVNGKRESFAITAVRETPDGWCVDQQSLASWFDLGIKADVYNSVLTLDTERKLPVEMAMLRKARGQEIARKRNAALQLSNAPGVRIPYKLWRTPALEVVVNAGVRYGGKTGVKTRRDANVYAAGELAAMSYLASMSVGQNGMPQNLWARLYRSDPDGKLLGPLHATHIAAGDVPGLTSTFSGAGVNGRGLVVTNRPLSQIGSFDRTEFRGQLPDGWDAELYRNGTLVAFDSDSDGDGDYLFEDVGVMIGDNDYEIILHGPQGQEQHIRDTLNVGNDSAPPGKLWYWAGLRQPGKDLFSFQKGKPPPTLANGDPIPVESDGPVAVVQAQYGIDKRTAVAALVRSALRGDERVTYVEGSLRRSLGSSIIELAGQTSGRGDYSARAQVIAKVGRATISASSLLSDGLAGTSGVQQLRDLRSSHRLGVGLPFKLGKTPVSITASAGKSEYSDSSTAIDGQFRLGTRIGNFDLANTTTYRKSRDSFGATDTILTTELIGAAHIGAVRLRGTAEADILPQSRLRALYLDAYWSKSERIEWNAGVRYDAIVKRGSLQLSHIRRLDSMALTFTGEASSDGSVAAGVRFSFSLDPAYSGLRPSRDRLATQGLVHARVYEDLNENGHFDSGEPVAKNAALTTGLKLSTALTDDQGKVTVGGLSPYVPLAVGIDQSSLDNPALAPSKPIQVIVPRPGVAAVIDIALVGGGSIEGFAAKSDGSAYEGLDFELLDEAGAVVGTARSDIDGYIVFENIRYGKFALRLTSGTASAIHAAPLEPLTVVINRDKPAARIGSIKIAALK